MATATVHTRTELRIFYALVLALALYGQSTGASTWLIPTNAGPLQTAALWLLVIAFVLVLELGAVVLLRRAETQRRGGQPAVVAILAAIALALAAAGLSWAGHWGPSTADQIRAFAFAGSTLLGVIVWAIMADLSIDPTVARHRSVQSAVRRYIRDLSMDASEKAVLLATMDVPAITALITGGPDGLDAADGRDRNVRIARILARAIDPDTWHGPKPAPKPVKAAAVPAPRAVAAPSPRPAAPQRRAATAVPRGGPSNEAKRAALLAAWQKLRTELGTDRPPCRVLADAAGVGKSLAAKWLDEHLTDNGQEQTA